MKTTSVCLKRGQTPFQIKPSLSRRDAFKASATLALGFTLPTILPRAVLGDNATAPPSERVTIGHIGVGGRGSYLMNAVQNRNGIQSVAVADCYQSRRESAAAKINGKAYADFRELLDRQDIDAVIIATPDHWHVPIAMLAAEAGKDCYVEKPLGLTIEQDLACQKIFTDRKRIFQYGTQQREAKHQQFGRELVRSGALGEIKAIEVQAPNGGRGGSTEKTAVPADFDYDMWLGPAPKVPYTADRCKAPGTYWIYDQSIGYLAGWGAHPLDIMVWCYDGDLAGPYSVEGTGVIPTDGLYDTVIDWEMNLRMADGVKVTFKTGSDSTKFIGTKARLELTRNSIRTFPTELSSADLPPNNHGNNGAQHILGFAQSVRTRMPASSPIEDAVRSDVISHLCDIAVRTKEKITWNPATHEIIGGSTQAESMVSRPTQQDWTAFR